MSNVKIYADTTTGFLHFDGSRISPKPLNGVCEASASNKAFRIRITRNDLLQSNGNPRVMFKHLKMNRVAKQDGTNLRLDLGYSRSQIIDYINAEAQKVVDTSFGSDESINTSGIITATRFIGDGSLLTGIVATGTGVEVRDGDSVIGSASTINFGTNLSVTPLSGGITTVTSSIGVATDGGQVGTGVTQLKFIGTGVSAITTPVSGVSTVIITSNGPEDIDAHLNVGIANTNDILTYDGVDYNWRHPDQLGIQSGNPVVRGLVTGIGNTTLRLVMQDSSLVDIDASTLNTTGSDADINSRISKAVSFARTETTYLRQTPGGASNNMWQAAFMTPGSTPLGMGSAADTHVSNDGNAQPYSQTIIFRNAGINTDRDSVLVGISDGDESDILASGILSHYIGISSTKKLVHHFGEPHVLGIGTTQANRAELMDVKDDTFYGIFFDHDGQRFGTGVSTSQLNSQFRYKLVDLSNGDVTDLTPNWTHYGKSQDGNGDSRMYGRIMYGALTGSGTNATAEANIQLKFEGDIAQATNITYQQGAVLLDDTQVSLMVRDPEKYLRDYKVGTSSRRPYFDTTQNFALNLQNYHYQAAQVWLMGDGDYDIVLGSSNGQGVKNFVNPHDYMKLNWPDYPSYTGFTDVSVTTGPTFASTKSTKFENLDRATRSRQSGEFTNLIKASGSSASAYTLSFWFRPGNNTHENQNIFNAFSQYNTFEGTSVIRVMYNGNTASTRNIRFNVQDQSGGLDKDNYNLDLSTPVGDVTHTNGSNGFHHVVITNSGGANAYQSSSLGVKIYINGVNQTLTDNSNGGGLPDVGIGTNTFSITPNNIALGRQPTNANFMRDSKLDELSFFNTELNATEVACLYNGGTPSDLDIFVPAPAHWYRMGDGDSGTTLVDSVGNADLSMTNMSDANFVTIVPS